MERYSSKVDVDSDKFCTAAPSRPLKTEQWVSHITTSSTRTISARTGRAVSAPGSTSPGASSAVARPARPRLPNLAKVREGRGFTLAELKEAGIGKKEARGVGIVVDHRRRNLSEEGKAVNVERLKSYKARLIVFPRNAKKPKTGDSTGDDLTAATTRANIVIPSSFVPEAPRKITSDEREFQAFRTLRNERASARNEGKRKLREAKKAEEEANKKK
ncbi:60S ribosomal protein L13 [Grifola frondosa]|uniref:60S ribosomal protein L13 n=1 Tax=Grifola frondosa TaxID=5627 RepID=A0A1C7MRC9_GRIFR|nr:60S ribosomal protein L13 [Grifola frondosa]